MININEVPLVASQLLNLRTATSERLERIRSYVRGDNKLTFLPYNTPPEMQALAKSSRTNLLELQVRNVAQQLQVDGYTNDSDPEGRIWSVWEANRLTSRQSSVYRDASKYGVGYVFTYQTDTGVPSIRSYSPLQLTAGYLEETDDFPRAALLKRNDGTWWFIDDTHVHELTKIPTRRNSRGEEISFVHTGVQWVHGSTVCPVVRFLSDSDNDDPVVGDVEPLLSVQDQINLTGFHLAVAEHYGAMGRRIIVGQIVSQLREQIVANDANTMMGIPVNPDEVQIEEFTQTDLERFIASRNHSIELMSAMGQTPVQELRSSMVNLSAAALVEGQESTERKISQRQLLHGESWEQVLTLVGEMQGVPVDVTASVRWKPSRSSRSRELISMLAPLVTQYGIPAEAVIPLLPFDASDVERFREAVTGSPEPEAPVDGEVGDVPV